jgi:hypothetical protein
MGRRNNFLPRNPRDIDFFSISCQPNHANPASRAQGIMPPLAANLPREQSIRPAPCTGRDRFSWWPRRPRKSWVGLSQMAEHKIPFPRGRGAPQGRGRGRCVAIHYPVIRLRHKCLRRMPPLRQRRGTYALPSLTRLLRRFTPRNDNIK